MLEEEEGSAGMDVSRRLFPIGCRLSFVADDIVTIGAADGETRTGGTEALSSLPWFGKTVEKTEKIT